MAIFFNLNVTASFDKKKFKFIKLNEISCIHKK